MQFLKTLFWVLVAVVIALFGSRNWFDVTLNLWGDLQLDIKVPVLLLLVFLIGFLPTFLVQRAKLWTMQRRLEAHERQQSQAIQPAPASSEAAEGDPVI